MRAIAAVRSSIASGSAELAFARVRAQSSMSSTAPGMLGASVSVRTARRASAGTHTGVAPNAVAIDPTDSNVEVLPERGGPEITSGPAEGSQVT